MKYWDIVASDEHKTNIAAKVQDIVDTCEETDLECTPETIECMLGLAGFHMSHITTGETTTFIEVSNL